MIADQAKDALRGRDHRHDRRRYSPSARCRPGVATFEELHDHLDANEYLQEAGVPFGTDPGAGVDGCEAVNAVAAEVDRQLAARAAAS